ncbi:MAG: TonB-dependent receptor, partial [Armatimonadetes bacterium]|nr:TonB-dependent receptor [Armatimonadota bacterium]
INTIHQIKCGIEINYDDFNTYYGNEEFDVTGNYYVKWEASPYRVGGYIQDKVEIEGMIANVGIRIDYNDPNVEWYTVDRYSKYFSRAFKHRLTEECPTERAKGHLKVSPRIGISHPISDKSKLYFNYGHFYSMPPTPTMYEINFGVMATGILSMGNPNLDLPRTIAYELGYEHSIGDMYLIGITGYYRDITNQIGERRYINYDESVNYATYDNSNYEDVRGLEIVFEKRWGRWITWWLNYNYLVRKSGYFGREEYYQDPRQQAIYGLRNPKQEKFLPEPFARASVRIRSPEGWGPSIWNIYPFEQFSITFLAKYKSGRHFTWDPVPPFTKEDNIQWKSYYNFDLRISKDIQYRRTNITIFADIYNVFDIKYLTGLGFRDEYDFRDYMRSLHLPMYNDPKYKNAGYIPGNDKPGDVRSKDKPYIDMPDINFMAWNPPRSVVFGLRLEF